ncbi:DMT family transporter [Curtobacterium sp. MCPF17_052]|uniref:DMT family transporter n=1 Tax=Curtobacterium sp. MCPF17_052 TaxID=2175655 RepID=UPI0024E03BE4|nr:DMT family transporter [Curtobacterium sp. MCPF17_052]WIB13544.1 DMT family transporter [Curtobacterium sp. MCPF17_052]
MQLSVLAASGVTIYTICSTLAIAFAGPVLPTLIIALTPAVVMVAEGILARTVPPSATIIGTAIAVTGALLYVMPRLHRSVGGDVALGLMFAVLAMSATAFYGVYFARVNREYRGALAARLFPIFALGAAPLVLWAGYSVIRGATMTWSTVGLLALLGTVVYVPVYLLQHRILLTAGASYAATLGLGVPPVVGIASGGHEPRPHAGTGAGCCHRLHDRGNVSRHPWKAPTCPVRDGLAVRELPSELPRRAAGPREVSPTRFVLSIVTSAEVRERQLARFPIDPCTPRPTGKSRSRTCEPASTLARSSRQSEMGRRPQGSRLRALRGS